MAEDYRPGGTLLRALWIPQWIIFDTGNSYGSRNRTADPADAYHYTELPGAYPRTSLCLQKHTKLGPSGPNFLACN